MLRYKVTNISQKTEKGPRNVFLTEVGKLLKPGEHCVCNRLDSGTHSQASAGILKVEEGSFNAPPIFQTPEPVAKLVPDAEVKAAPAPAESVKAEPVKEEPAPVIEDSPADADSEDQAKSLSFGERSKRGRSKKKKSGDES